MKELRTFSLQHNHAVSVSGGGDRMDYMVSANYYYKNGLLAYGPDDYNRYNLLAKMNTKINKNVDLGVNIQVIKEVKRTESSYGSEELFGLLFDNRGRQPIYQPERENYEVFIMVICRIIRLI